MNGSIEEAGAEESIGPRTPVRLDGEHGGGERWIETKSGSLFFVNALLVGPLLIILFPLALGAGLRLAGAVEGPLPILDVFPLMARFVVPWAAWILVVPIALVVRNLRMEIRTAPRVALGFFLLLHLSFIGSAAWWWITGGEPPLTRSF
jgi:hypothetical protein